MLEPTLDVAIGLVFVFILFSSLLSVVVEAVATIMKLRSKALENALINMLEDPSTRVFGVAPENLFQRVTGLFSAQKRIRAQVRATDGHKGVSFFDAVYYHPLVGGISVKNRPSYVPAGNFASAIVYVLSGATHDGPLSARVQKGITELPQELSTLKTALVTIWQETNGDVLKFKTGLETWFNAAMDRLSGDYKRYSQAITFILGLIAAVACNVDTLKVAERLYAEPGLRTALADSAADYVKTPLNEKAGNADATLDAQLVAVGRAQKLLLANAPPVGWSGDKAPKGWGLLAATPGWILTALAGMMGAGFWFGMLQKLIDLRGAGPKPKANPGPSASADD